MHEYSIDVEHNNIFFILAGLSILISGGLTTLINFAVSNIPYVGFTVSIAAMGVFGVLYSLFDRHIWKWKIIQKTGLVRIPNLNGVWKGHFSSSYFNFENNSPATFMIEQSWSKICIKGKFGYSKSSSDTTSIKVNDGGGIKLFYSYYNDKNPEHYDKSMTNHRGYGRLEVVENSITGSYFNDPTNNNNHGTLKLTKH